MEGVAENYQKCSRGLFTPFPIAGGYPPNVVFIGKIIESFHFQYVYIERRFVALRDEAGMLMTTIPFGCCLAQRLGYLLIQTSKGIYIYD